MAVNGGLILTTSRENEGTRPSQPTASSTPPPPHLTTSRCFPPRLPTGSFAVDFNHVSTQQLQTHYYQSYLFTFFFSLFFSQYKSSRVLGNVLSLCLSLTPIKNRTFSIVHPRLPSSSSSFFLVLNKIVLFRVFLVLAKLGADVGRHTPTRDTSVDRVARNYTFSTENGKLGFSLLSFVCWPSLSSLRSHRIQFIFLNGKLGSHRRERKEGKTVARSRDFDCLRQGYFSSSSTRYLVSLLSLLLTSSSI